MFIEASGSLGGLLAMNNADPSGWIGIMKGIPNLLRGGEGPTGQTPNIACVRPPFPYLRLRRVTARLSR